MADDGDYPKPRIETPMPPGASHELADQALEWMDVHAPGDVLMPYQRHVIRRALETVDGRLYWRRVLLLVARQQGKTYLMRRLLLWRQVEGSRLLGQPQHVMNLAPGYDLAERLLEPWAEELVERFGGRKRAKTHAYDYYLDGDERGPTWSSRVLRRETVTGSSTTCTFVDEVQDARYAAVHRGLQPTMSGSRVLQPQMFYAGVGAKAGPDAALSEQGRLLRELREDGMSASPKTLVLEWSAPPGIDPTDRQAWRWASPDWSPAREELLEGLASLDSFPTEFLVQHDPVSGVEDAHWLNLTAWEESRRALSAPSRPDVAAVEDRWPDSAAAALVWRTGPTVNVWARMFPDMDTALSAVSAAPLLLCGATLLKDPRMRARGAEPAGQRDTSVALPELRRQVRAGRLRWDGDDLDTQVRLVKLREATTGALHVQPRPPSELLRAAAWAVYRAVTAPAGVPQVF